MISCAQMVAPNGGPKDLSPPKVVKETPLNKNTSFSADKISIQFDEYVQLKDIEEQIVISPPLPEKPIIEVAGKNINIVFRSNLSPNTTYTINFGNSILDNRENTVLSNYNYVFATGPQLDTLHISGHIKNAFDNKVEKGLLVCLYKTDSFTDSTSIKEKPIYFSKTDDKGYFLIDNLPNQYFHLIVFKDENKNLKYDKNEKVAFADTVINPTDTIPLAQLLAFAPDLYPINSIIDTITKDLGKVQFVIYKPSQNNLKPVDAQPYFNWKIPGKNNLDTSSFYHSEWKTDSIFFNYHTDVYDTTFYVKPKKSGKITPFVLSIPKEVELNDSFTILFNQPYQESKLDTHYLVIQEDTNILNLNPVYSTDRKTIKFYHPLKEKTKYSIVLRDSAFTDIYGNYSKKQNVTIQTKTLKDYSILILNFIHPGDTNQYIAQLVTEDESRVYKSFIIAKDETINLEYILPAKYKVKIIRDTNKNGIWDNGDFQLKRQPEKVFYYPEVLTLRAYWDLEQIIDLNKIVD